MIKVLTATGKGDSNYQLRVNLERLIYDYCPSLTNEDMDVFYNMIVNTSKSRVYHGHK